MTQDSPSSNLLNWPAPRVTVAIATYRKVTSVVFFSQRTGVKVTGGMDAHLKAYKAAQRHTAIFGWWGIPFGLIWTPMTLFNNKKMLRSVQALLASGNPKAAWMKDPSGKFEERYWDGQAWTDQVRSTTSDAPPVSQ